MQQQELEKLHKQAKDRIAIAKSLQELHHIRVEYLGKRGLLTKFLRSLGELPAEQRPKLGSLVNAVKEQLEQELATKEQQLKERVLSKNLQEETLDVTLPGRFLPAGSLHPIWQVVTEIEEIFLRLGFDLVDGPEIESDFYNFEALNIAKEHPARDMHDSFYLSEDILLRTHTSAIQIRALHKLKDQLPIKIASSGKVYRRDTDDATHSHQFTQIEGLVVDKEFSMAQLHGLLVTLLKELFGQDVRLRLRPSYFPFTEPSVEVDIYTEDKGWLEILGAGMVHPKVLKYAGLSPERLTGCAFGLGVERIAMLKYSIPDIRLLYSNDVRLLRQFTLMWG